MVAATGPDQSLGAPKEAFPVPILAAASQKRCEGEVPSHRLAAYGLGQHLPAMLAAASPPSIHLTVLSSQSIVRTTHSLAANLLVATSPVVAPAYFPGSFPCRPRRRAFNRLLSSCLPFSSFSSCRLLFLLLTFLSHPSSSLYLGFFFSDPSDSILLEGCSAIADSPPPPRPLVEWQPSRPAHFACWDPPDTCMRISPTAQLELSAGQLFFLST